MATLKDVAQAVGVSVATVSYVLTGRGSVSEATREKVLEAVETLGYRPNRNAQAMRTGVTKTLGLLLPDLTNPFFPELAQKIENTARNEGFSVLLIDYQHNRDTESEAFELFNQQGVDGVIWCPASDQAPASLALRQCPVVLIDQPLTGFDAVHADFYRGGQLLAEHAHTYGHRKIGLLSGPQEIESARARRLGFIERALDLDPDIALVWEVFVPFQSEIPREAQLRLKENSVSMVIAADDLIAVGAVSALSEQGLRVPEDVSVVGFDNIPWTMVMTPKLTTIHQPINALAAEAVAMLMQKIIEPDKPARTVTLDVDLITRQSVRDLNKD